MTEVNAAVSINQLLAQKPPINYEVDVEVWEDVWEELPDRPAVTRGTLHRVRRRAKVIRRQTAAAPAEVIDSEVVVAHEVEWRKEKMTSLPEKLVIQRVLYTHCSEGTLSVPISLSVSASKGFTVSKSKGVTTTQNHRVNLNIPLSFGAPAPGPNSSLSFGVDFNTSTSISTTEQETSSKQESRSFGANLNLTKKERGYVELIAYQFGISVPFKAKVTVDGNLKPNISGLMRASQLLSETERTFEIEGELVAHDVSQGHASTVVLPGLPNCDNAPPLITSTENPLYPPGTVMADAATRSRMFILTDDNIAQPAAPDLPTWDGATMGPPTGTTYYVTSSYTIGKFAVQCGFSDLGVPNTGIFNVEEREYTTWVDGKASMTWRETVETFQSCPNVS
ncbi:hypothetical protein ACFOD4_04570 [Pseudoroseomonas globiformis]|uniref:Uncharacterized protein n=1 Tax=Teichococcus globiformis TaxID=2307229 RepID=A0ABV7FYE3_9PROT